ncbi:rhomboid family intramembrane serine protease [Oscillatoria sp. CS-180]|uniref:rhomboid family intramembrane serine protease n=1 Tax=Oscillatoria sp. CS-180 TaxID=3021720 RepID=UPI00232A95B0|nr:rhomboid family intramembrane serine protease [Oscillatoria sp. CS-180]MDB9526218.1 rhomboid family intramembrane serine protease [Oscillatoria sp. CS-180]
MAMTSNRDRDLQEEMQRLMAEVETGYAPAQSNQGAQRSQVKTKPSNKGFLAKLKGNLLLPIWILAIPWSQEIIDQVVFAGNWNLPIHPRSLDGVAGIFLSAFSHSGFIHLISNTIGFLIFSWLILAKSRRDYWVTFGIGYLGGGVASWLLGPTSVHGLSGVVYTLFGYLLVIGWLERRLVPLLISVFVLVNYSATLWGVLPTQPMVAWWGHLFGLILGIFAAIGIYQEPEAKT